jgi:ubiquinone/menaquinone biosynthesis C-methylase UbiE
MTEETSPQGQIGVLPVLQSKDETRAYYNKIAKVYDLLAERSEQPMRDAALEKLAAAPGEQVLEIGFGTGHTLATLARTVGPGGKVFGIDLSDHMVAMTRELLQKEGLGDRAELQCGDAEHLPHPDGSLDAVLMIFTLELFDTPAIPRVLAECRRVLRPGGRIVVAGISKEGKQGLVIKAFEWTHRHFPNLMDCRPIYVRRALESAGFRIQDVAIEHMWVPVEIALAVRP